ncbi:hypothetical protein ASD24_03875 [Paenibacillus sp. Root52]|uniref:hypothetical protein n=1 Tax=Paenibacillus sp. Root52 TaxID=1736552 RepID=UPI0006F61B3B|nr:hypothetical protein [Paenibacillus sp. Root52]KQY94691.1 hypothetical protein ASD24_03875 [Paenibacillus sp. Root52]
MNRTSEGLPFFSRFLITNVIVTLIAVGIYGGFMLIDPQAGVDMSDRVSIIFYFAYISVPVFVVIVLLSTVLVWLRDRLLERKHFMNVIVYHVVFAGIVSVLFYLALSAFYETGFVLAISPFISTLTFSVLYETYITKT